MEYTLNVSNLKEQFYTRRGIYKALNGVDILLRKGEILGIAGESGCGKTTLGLTIIGLLPRNAVVTDGEVLLDGKDLIATLREFASKEANNLNLRHSENIMKKLNKELINVRGSRISMVFQDPMTSLNPVLRIGYQIAETLMVHQPEVLAKRRLARSKVSDNDLREALKLLENGADEQSIKAFAETRQVEGIEEQLLNIWRRNDLGIARKEKMILSLRSERLGGFDMAVLQRVVSQGRIDGWMRIPGLNRMSKAVLIKEGNAKAVELLSSLEIPNPEEVVKMYPHELSGGMRQRIIIAIALANNPELVIMDEPTSALDVTVQAQILDLLKHLKQRFNTSFILISHDLSVLAEVCDRIGIMYAGRIVEVASVDAIFNKPLHPYTSMLISAVPTIKGGEIQGIGGAVPDMRFPPSGCMFHPRCPYVMDKCRENDPQMKEVEDEHLVACYLYEGQKGEQN